jgi:predicted MFS family arabinose efflux permease
VAYGVAIYLQEKAGFSALETGFAFLGMALMAVVGGLVSGRMAAKSGTKPVIVGGLVTQVLGTILCTIVLANQGAFWPVFLALSVFGLGQSAAAAQLNNVVLSDVPVAESGDGGAANSTIRQVGNSVGTALVGGIAAIQPGLVMVGATLIGAIAVAIGFILPNVKNAGGGGMAVEG